MYSISYFRLFKYMVSFSRYFTVCITYQPPLVILFNLCLTANLSSKHRNCSPQAFPITPQILRICKFAFVSRIPNCGIIGSYTPLVLKWGAHNQTGVFRTKKPTSCGHECNPKLIFYLPD